MLLKFILLTIPIRICSLFLFEAEKESLKQKQLSFKEAAKFTQSSEAAIFDVRIEKLYCFDIFFCSYI